MQINTMTEACDQMLSASDVGELLLDEQRWSSPKTMQSLRQLLAQEIEYMSSKECA